MLWSNLLCVHNVGLDGGMVFKFGTNFEYNVGYSFVCLCICTPVSMLVIAVLQSGILTTCNVYMDVNRDIRVFGCFLDFQCKFAQKLFFWPATVFLEKTLL